MPRFLFALGLFLSYIALPVAAQPYFTPHIERPTNPYGLSTVVDHASPTFADLDNDGDLDLLTAGAANGGKLGDQFLYYENTGTNAAPRYGMGVALPFGLTSVGQYQRPAFIDLDQDLDFDLMVGRENGDLVYFQNTGTPTAPSFAAAQVNPFGLGASASGRSAPAFFRLDAPPGDFDWDLIVGEANGDFVMYRNTGTVNAPAFTSLGTNPFGLTDAGSNSTPLSLGGHLLVGNASGDVLLYTNSGTASTPAFAAPQTNPQGLENVGTFSALGGMDTDDDEEPERLLVGNQAGDFVPFQITVNAGTTVFQRLQSNPFGLLNVGTDAHPALGDLNGDGTLDLLATSGAGDFLFYANTGTRTAAAFGAAQTNPFSLPSGAMYAAPALGDMDADGDLDLFAREVGGPLRYFRNTGTPTAPSFAAPSGLAPNSGNDWAVAVGRINDDALVDLVIGQTDGSLRVYLNSGSASTPSFGAVQVNPFGLQDLGSNSAPAFADTDGDGDLDLLIGLADGTLHFVENTSSGKTISFATPTIALVGLIDIGTFSFPTLGNLDADSDFDLIAGNGEGEYVFFRNTGSALAPMFESAQDLPFGLTDAGAQSVPTLVDLDGDTDLDVVVATQGSALQFYHNTGSPTAPAFAAPVSNHLGLSGTTNSAATFGDLDGDTDLDVLWGGLSGDFAYQARTAGGTYSIAQVNPFGLQDLGDRSHPTLGDLDGDGDLDLIAGRLNGDLVFLENAGTANAPAFLAPAVNALGLSNLGSRTTPALGDLDQDGDLDLIAGRTDGDILYLQNIGSATHPMFAPPQVNLPGLPTVPAGGLSAPTFGDLDGDGDLDVLAGNSQGTFQSANRTGAGNPLPVELTHFTVTLNGEVAMLRWVTASEINNAGFDVQHSRSAKQPFTTIGFVDGTGTTLHAQTYTFRSTPLETGTHRFRLKQVDYDGTFALSPTVEVAVDLAKGFIHNSAYPNPFSTTASFTLSVQQSQRVDVTVYNALGQRMTHLWQGTWPMQHTETFVVDGTRWASGLYIVRITGETFRSQRMLLHLE